MAGATLIDLNVKIGKNYTDIASTPCIISTNLPLITWTVPENINQVRFNIRMKSVALKGEIQIGNRFSSDNFFQYENTEFTTNFLGLMTIEVTISSKDSGAHEYTSGPLYFVYDPVTEILQRSNYVVFRWENSSDNETQWNEMQYHLSVASSPTFEDESILYESLVPATSRLTSSCAARLTDSSLTYVYYRMRSFDGIDYSDYSNINGFIFSDNTPPSISISRIVVEDNNDKDVIIYFSVEDTEFDKMMIEVYYSGGNMKTTYKLASLVNNLTLVDSGQYSIVWRSSLDEEKISSSDYKIKMIATDEDGMSGYCESQYFSMDNSSVGLDAGGNGSFENNYILIGRTALYHRHFHYCNPNNPSEKTYSSGGVAIYPSNFYPSEIPEYTSIDGKNFINNYQIDCNTIKNSMYGILGTYSSYGFFGNIISNEKDYRMDMEPPLICSMASWSFYRTGNLDSDLEKKGLISEIYGYNMKYPTMRGYPCGMKKNSVSSPSGSDLDTMDDDFIDNMENVDSNGRYRKMSPDLTDSGTSIRRGYIRFLKTVYASSRDRCTVCSGKGWNGVYRDYSVPDNYVYKYKRAVCENCHGLRFVLGDYSVDKDGNKPVLKNTEFLISSYVAIGDFFAPLNNNFILDSMRLKGEGGKTPYSIFQYNNFNNVNRKASNFYPEDIAETVSSNGKLMGLYIQKDANTVDNKLYGTNGVYGGFYFRGYNAITIDKDYKDNGERVCGNLGPAPENIQEHISPLLGSLTSGYKNYIPGTTYENSILASGRDIPTWEYERGFFSLFGSLYKESEMSSLKIVFLQSSWSVYNTIHWVGPASVNTLTQVQYCKLNADGSDGSYKDVIAEDSYYYQDGNCWMIPAQKFYCFWKTENQIRNTGEDKYRLRIRQYNIVSKEFSKWSIAASTFSIYDVSVNPANIYYVEYKKFEKKLYIYYRLDDVDNEEFNIQSVSYRVGTGEWIEITGKIDGTMINLSSTRIMGTDGSYQNEHCIVWDTSSYNLMASDDYRIKIDVIKTKYVSGYSGLSLSWYKNVNTLMDKYLSIKDKYTGWWQRYYYDEASGSIKLLKKQVFIKGDIGTINDRILEVKSENSPLPDGSNGYFSFCPYAIITKDSNGIITNVDYSSNSSGEYDASLNSSTVIDGTTYYLSDWMKQKDSNGDSRNSRISSLSEELNEIYSNIDKVDGRIEGGRREIRRSLIDQGYYCNGFKNNTPVYDDGDTSNSDGSFISGISPSENSKFDFKVITFFKDSFYSSGFYKPKYSEYAGSVIKTITETDSKADGSTAVSSMDIHEYERTVDVYSRIQIDQVDTFNSKGGRPFRDIIFYDGERIVTTPAGNNYLSEANGNYNKKNPAYDTYIMKSNQLPGNCSGDVSLWEDFFGDYMWRVASYNILYGVPVERPVFSATNGAFSGNGVPLSVVVKGDRDITTSTIDEIYYIDEFYENFFIESNSSSYSNYNLVKFPTDPPKEAIDFGLCNQMGWSPIGVSRTRPCVVIDRYNQYHVWYSKKNDYDENIIAYARGKNFDAFAEYGTMIPFDNIEIDKIKDDLVDFSGTTNIFSPAVIYTGTSFIAYYVVQRNGLLQVYGATSLDGYEWSNFVPTGIADGSYGLFAKLDGHSILLYYCRMDTIDGVTRSRLYCSSSSDGNVFSNEEVVLDSEYDIISSCKFDDYIYYTEWDGSSYNTRCNSNMFPDFCGFYNPFVIKDGNGYRIYLNKDSSNSSGSVDSLIYTFFMKNYNEKNIVKRSSELQNVLNISKEGLLCSESGKVTDFIINKNASTWGYYFCSQSFRDVSQENILGWVIKGHNDMDVKEYMIQSTFLSENNMAEAEGEMTPYPYKYTAATKDMATLGE